MRNNNKQRGAPAKGIMTKREGREGERENIWMIRFQIEQ